MLEVIRSSKIVCPYRTLTINKQLDDMSVSSEVFFPECQYDECPFYETEIEDKHRRCTRVNIEGRTDDTY